MHKFCIDNRPNNYIKVIKIVIIQIVIMIIIKYQHQFLLKLKYDAIKRQPNTLM